MGSNSCLLLCMLLLLVLEKNSSFVRFQFIKSPITIATIKKINVYSSVEGSETSIHDDNEMDINLIEETVLDQSIEKAVRQMLDDGPKQIELSPTEKFKLLYEVSSSTDIYLYQFTQL